MPRRRKFGRGVSAPSRSLEYSWKEAQTDMWRLHRNGQPTAIFVAIDEDQDSGQYELWEGDNYSGDSENISTHRQLGPARSAAMRYMRANPTSGYSVEHIKLLSETRT